MDAPGQSDRTELSAEPRTNANARSNTDVPATTDDAAPTTDDAAPTTDDAAPTADAARCVPTDAGRQSDEALMEKGFGSRIKNQYELQAKTPTCAQ
jgi:hypothetical protein